MSFLFIRFFDESDSVSILSTSYMPANELRLELRRKDIEIVMLRKAVQEAEVRIINQRQNILNEFRGNAVVKQESDQKFFEESQERLKIYYEKRVKQIKKKVYKA